MIIEKSQAEKLYEAHCKFYQQAPVRWDALATVTKTYWTFMAGEGDLELREGKVITLSNYRPIADKTIKWMHQHVLNCGKELDAGWVPDGGIYITRVRLDDATKTIISRSDYVVALGLMEEAKASLLNE